MKYFIATLLLLNGLAVGQETSALSLKTHIALPNVDGRMDHFSVDIKGQRLFASALGNNTVEVIDLQSGQRVRTLPGLAEPQGLLRCRDQLRTYYSPSPIEGVDAREGLERARVRITTARGGIRREDSGKNHGAESRSTRRSRTHTPRKNSGSL